MSIIAWSYWATALTIRTPTDHLIYRRTGGKDTEIELYDRRDTPDPVKNVTAGPDLVNELLNSGGESNADASPVQAGMQTTSKTEAAASALSVKNGAKAIGL